MLRERIILNVKWAEVGKTSEVFWAKLYCKMCDLFCYFLLALKLSARNSEIKEKLTGTSGQIWKLCMLEKIFSRKNSKYDIFESLIFWFKCRFLGDCFRTFFVVGQPLWSTFLLSYTHHKKLPTALFLYEYNITLHNILACIETYILTFYHTNLFMHVKNVCVMCVCFLDIY